jgi:hypothetical protein
MVCYRYLLAIVMNTKSNTMTSKRLITVLVILLIIASAGAVYFYKQSHDATKDPQKDLQQTIQAVGKLMVLPNDEVPTLATVSDPEKLKDQAFFAKAQVGDKVLIYTKAHKAILYSPSRNVIVEVSPLNITGGQ